MNIISLYISNGHNYVGHHGRDAGTNQIQEVQRARCVAGRGIVGDRYFNREKDHKCQITFFDYSVYQNLCEKFQKHGKSTAVFRRNVITDGVDLNSLIGREFEVQGVRFFGEEESKPCYWMDQAFCPGTENELKGRGGLRAKILTSGTLHCLTPDGKAD